MTRSAPLIAWLIACYAFLYAPIAFLIALSFNASRLVTAWAGFSPRWYVTLAHDDTLIDAALLSLRIAAASATLALIVGTLAGYALARFGRFRARTAFAAAVAAPLVLPEVITGLSLLLLFVALEQADRLAGTARRHDGDAGARLGVGGLCRRGGAGAPGRRRHHAGGSRHGPLRPALACVRPDNLAPAGAGAGLRLAAGVHPVAGRRGGGELHLRPRRFDAADGGVLLACASARRRNSTRWRR